MDFYFPDKGKAARFMSFLEDVVPMKVSLMYAACVLYACVDYIMCRTLLY